MALKIIRVEFENLNYFDCGKFKVDFYATDRVFGDSELYKISNAIVAQNLIAFTGLNAGGKTMALRLLKIALNVIINNADLNSFQVYDMLDSDTIMRIMFFHNGNYYQLESIIGRDDSKLFYKEEILKEKKSEQIRSRKSLDDFSSAKVKKRSELPPDVKAYMDESKSFIAPTVKGNDGYVSDNLWLNHVNIAATAGEIPSAIISLFDDSIESLAVENTAPESSPVKWKLKFKNKNVLYSAADLIALNLIISTGTIRGQELIQRAAKALKKGGYLIFDELEMHLNKEIVKVILELFKSAKTNPNGACLIFSTHYPELLDSINRKDNIYITRKKNDLLSVSKYSDEFKRNDFKKSEIILSNALSGTAPKYENIKKLRDYICSLF